MDHGRNTACLGSVDLHTESVTEPQQPLTQNVLDDFYTKLIDNWKDLGDSKLIIRPDVDKERLEKLAQELFPE